MFKLKTSFRNTIRVSNSLDPDQARRFVGPDLGPNYLQRLAADVLSGLILVKRQKSPLDGKELKTKTKQIENFLSRDKTKT